jgi:cytochrome c oxidase subunit 2
LFDNKPRHSQFNRKHHVDCNVPLTARALEFRGFDREQSKRCRVYGSIIARLIGVTLTQSTTKPRTDLIRSGGIAALALSACLTGGCDGPQSALDPAGYEASRLADFFWVMCIGALIIWAGMMAIALYAARRRPPPENAANILILGGGVVFSLVILTALLSYGLWLMGGLRDYAAAG